MNSFTKKPMPVKDHSLKPFTLCRYKSNNTYGLMNSVPSQTEKMDGSFSYAMSMAQNSIVEGYWTGGITYMQSNIEYVLQRMKLPDINMNVFDWENHTKLESYLKENQGWIDVLSNRAMVHLRRMQQDLVKKNMNFIQINIDDRYDNHVISTIAFENDAAAVTMSYITQFLDEPISLHTFEILYPAMDRVKIKANSVPLIVTENEQTAKHAILRYCRMIHHPDSFNDTICLPISTYETFVTIIMLALYNYDAIREIKPFQYNDNIITVMKELMDKKPFNPNGPAGLYTQIVHAELVNHTDDDCQMDVYSFPRDTIADAKRIYPQFEFSESEDLFVSKYCSELIESNNYILDFRKYLDVFRFGNSIWFKYRQVSSKPLLGQFKPFKLNNSDWLEVHIWETINDSCVCSIHVMLKDIDHVSPKSMIVWDKRIQYLNKDHIMLSVQHIELTSDLLKLTTDDIYSLIVWMMYLQIVCVERPQRTRMIREVKYLNGDPTDTSDDNVYLISRILRPVKEAKEYMNERGSTPEQRKRGPYNYTVAEWERVGHWRTTKSGKKVWIEPQICHRKDGITKEYVKVKL